MNTVDWLSRLIAFDTTSRHSNLQLINCVDEYLRGLGLQPWRAWNADQSKANLFVTLPAHDGSIAGGTVLSGHTNGRATLFRPTFARANCMAAARVT